jgi:DNA-binding MarR family transcriptional regulator
MAERLIAARMAAAGVSDEQFALLSRLAVEGPVTTTRLADEMGVPFTTLADALARLDARGEITRVPNPRDQRSHLVELSELGWERIDAAQPALKSALTTVRKRLVAPADVDAALEDLRSALQDARAAEGRD